MGSVHFFICTLLVHEEQNIKMVVVDVQFIRRFFKTFHTVIFRSPVHDHTARVRKRYSLLLAHPARGLRVFKHRRTGIAPDSAP